MIGWAVCSGVEHVSCARPAREVLDALVIDGEQWHVAVIVGRVDRDRLIVGQRRLGLRTVAIVHVGLVAVAADLAQLASNDRGRLAVVVPEPESDLVTDVLIGVQVASGDRVGNGGAHVRTRALCRSLWQARHILPPPSFR